MSVDKKVWSEKICKQLTEEYAAEVIKLGKRSEEAAKSKNLIVDELPPILLEFYQKLVAEKGVAERMFGLYAIFALGTTVGKRMEQLDREMEDAGKDDSGGSPKNGNGKGRASA